MNVRRHAVRRWVLAIGLVSLALDHHPVSAQVTIDWVTVGDPGNAGETQTYGQSEFSPGVTLTFGAVAEAFQISKYLVTIGQYTDFLNAVAATDPYELYNTRMATDLNIAGILRSGTIGGYSYSVIDNDGNSANRPITYVSWYSAARFANWMHNGQGAGDTETGAYELGSNWETTNPPTVNPGAQFYIPTEDQWYKAAYYSPVKDGVGSPGYYKFATQNDEFPDNVVGPGTNQANFYNLRYTVTQSEDYSKDQNYLTAVGAFSNSFSLYGTFDQSGSVFEWNDLTGESSSFRGLRGGDWSTFGGFDMQSNRRIGSGNPLYADEMIGFRLASPVPEPATLGLASGGALCAGGWWVLRRRRRALFLGVR
jgi:sulfatase modifying factor 1